MLWTLFVIFLLMWLVGMITKVTFGGLVHLLLLFAVIVMLVNVISGRRTTV